MRIAQTLASARASGLARLDADLLLLLAMGVAAPELGKRRGWLLAHDDDLLDSDVQNRFRAFVARRHDGEPLAYICGHRSFYGLDLMVDARVLIPRPDTETLVDWALEVLDSPELGQHTAPLRLLDLGTGSGAIALALKHERPNLMVDAVDASADALSVARSNAARLGLELRWILGDWYEYVAPNDRYFCIVSNPPYVAQLDPHLAALGYEPIQALVAGSDGLRDIRRIVAGAINHLWPGGWLLLEHGFDQGAAVQALLQDAGFKHLDARRDLGGHWRCSGGQWPRQDPGQPRLLSRAIPGK